MIRSAARTRRGRRRAPATVMTAEEARQASKRIRRITKHAHKAGTLRVYTSYGRAINDWYGKNHPELCKDGEVDAEKFRTIVASSTEHLDAQAEIFRQYLTSHKHSEFKNKDGTPAIAMTSHLGGHRSAFKYLMWTAHGIPRIPADWTNSMTYLFKGLGSRID